MALKSFIFAVWFLAIVQQQVWAAIGDDCTSADSVCDSTVETCEEADGSKKCVAKECDATNCQNGGTCGTDNVLPCDCPAGFKGPTCDTACPQCENNGKCKFESGATSCDCAETGYEGATCNEMPCGSGTTCTSPQVCVGAADGKTCVDNPCKDTPCGPDGDCSYDETLTDPKFICTCKNGHGGTTCTVEPECESSEDCKDDAKPECKKEDGKQSVCGEKSNGGNTVAAAPGFLVAVFLAAIYL